MLWAASVVALAAASLAGKHHDVRRRLSETPDGCALYIAGPVVASSGNQVATVDSLQSYELTFTMELASDWSITGHWQTFFHIGDTAATRNPAVMFHESQNALHVMQAPPWQWGVVATTGPEFIAGETYDVKVVVQNNQMAVYVDGVSVGSASGSATHTATNAAVYLGDPWQWWGGSAAMEYRNVAKVTLSDITLSELSSSEVCRDNVAALNAPGIFTFQAGRCYPESEAPYIGTGGSMASWPVDVVGEGSPQECYAECVGDSDYMGLELTFTSSRPSGHECYCKVAEDDYNDSRDCKRPAGTSVAIEDMDWSSMSEDYVCFTEDFNADAEISAHCDEQGRPIFDDGGDNNNSDDNPLAVILGVVAAVVVVVGIVVFAITKRRKSAKPPAAAATPAHEPTAPIEALEMMAEEAPSSELVAEEPPVAEGRAAEAVAEESASADAATMHHRMQVWYNEAPDSAALRAAWGAYPTTPRALEAWPGFVAVTNAFLDHAGPPVAPAASPPEVELEPEC